MIKRIPWGPIRSVLKNCTFGEIKDVVSCSDNFDIIKVADLNQKSKNGATKDQLLSAIDEQVGRMTKDQLSSFVSICCEKILRINPGLKDELDRTLSRIGWKFYNEALVPVEILDISELENIPENSHADILKAACRLRDGDLSGALSAACGGIDSVTANLYIELKLGDPYKDSFQTRIQKCINALCLNNVLNKELESIGWDQKDREMLIHNLTGSLNQAAYVMQKLRSDMGDVHGTKLVVNALVYDSIKWSLLILRMLFIKKSNIADTIKMAY